MSHAHLPIQHLLAHIEKQGRRPRRKIRPDWITPIIEEVADLFEPLAGVGRVGFECCRAEDRWEVNLYLGTLEVVGGKDDGRHRPLNFQIDLQNLHRKFNLVERWEWTACPDRSNQEGGAETSSRIVIEGYWADNPIRMQLFEVPPERVGPGLREFPNGHREQI